MSYLYVVCYINFAHRKLICSHFIFDLTFQSIEFTQKIMFSDFFRFFLMIIQKSDQLQMLHTLSALAIRIRITVRFS